MESSQGQTAVTVESNQQAGVNGHQKKSGKKRETPHLRQESQTQTGKLRHWLHLLDQQGTAGGETGALIESLSFLQSLVEGSPDAIFVKDALGRYLFVNATLALWLCKQPDDLIGQTDAELFSPEVATLLSYSDAQVLQGGKAFTEEIVLNEVLLPAAGTERSLLTTKIPFRNPENRIVGLLGMARDNTLRKLMEEELRESKQFNEQVIANAREGVVVCDKDLRYVVWNTFMEEFSGIARHKVIGRHPLEIFPTLREFGMLDLLERALSGETISSPDFPVNSGAGARNAWATCRFGPLRDAKGDITGVIGTISDITEYKKTENKLRRSQQFNQQVIANASEGIVVFDRELRCMVWNPVLEDLSGLSASDVMGRSLLELAPHWRAVGLREMLQQALQGDTVEAPDFQIDPYRDRWVASRYSPLLDNDEQVIGVIGILTDVTARRQAEDALRESQQFNQQVIDSALEGITVYDRDLRVVVWNPAMEELLEIHRAQVLGERILEVFPQWNETEAPEWWKRALAGETINEREFKLRQRTEKWFSTSLAPLCNQRGEIVGLIATLRDITARKLAEEALQASQQFNQQIITNAREGIIVYDSDLTYVVWNPAMEEFLGIRAEAVLGKSPLAIFPEVTEKGIYDRLKRALAGETLARFDYDYNFGEGLPKGCFSRLDAPLRDERGQIVGVISTISDITDRKRAEEELRESQQFSQEIIANAREGIVVHDREFKIKIWNAAMEELSGVLEEAALGQNIFDLFPHLRDSAVPSRLADALDGRASVSKDFQLQPAAIGQERWLSARYGPHRNSKGEVVGVIVTIRDITSRRRVEDELRRSEERYREILATIQDGYFEISLEGDLGFFNEALCTIGGCLPEELSGEGYQTLLPPESRARIWTAFQQVRETSQSVKAFEFEIRRKDGDVRALETSISLIKHASGTAYGFRGIVRDVTERKQAEQQLQERDARFRALIENSYDGIVLISATGQTIYTSPSYTRIHGYSAEEVKDTSLVERIHPDDLPVVAQVREQLEPGKSQPIEYRIRNRANEYHWIEGQVTNLLEDPNVRAYVINFHDITERKQAEESLRTSEQRFRALVENGFDGISLQNAEGYITYVSPAYKRILGYEPEEAVGRKPFAQVHPDELDEALQARAEVLQTPGARRTLQFRTQHKDGPWRWLEVTLANLLDDPSVGALVANFRDITERHENEKALRESEEKFRAIWDNALDAMLIVNDDMQYVDANPAACELYGVSREELITRAMSDFVAPEKRTEARRSLSKLVHQGERKGHFHLVRSDHTIHEIEYNARANFLPGLHLSMMRDVTERNRAEAALRASEEQYRSLVSVLEEGILMLDSDGELITCNESAERILGASRGVLRERGILNPEWQAMREDGTPFPAAEAPSEVTLRTGQACSGVVIGIKRPAGDLCWLSVSSQPVYHQEAAQPQAVVLSITDITKRKAAEAALRESELRFSTAFDLSPLAVVIAEWKSGKLVNVNQAWCKMFGYTAEEALGQSALELGLWYKPEDRDLMVEQLVQARTVRDFETQLWSRNGELLQVMVAAERIELGQQQYLIALTQDITARKLAEERFVKAFNACPDAMTITTLHGGRYLLANTAMYKQSGLTPEQTLGRTSLELDVWVDPQQRQQLYEMVMTHGTVHDFEAQLRIAGGAVGDFLISTEPFKLGNEMYLLTVSKNITERKRMERELRSSEERFAQAFNASPDAMAITTAAEGRFLMVNDAWLNAFGQSREAVVGQSFLDFNPWIDPEQRRYVYQTIRATGSVRDYEAKARLANGELADFLVSADLVKLGDEEVVLSVSKNITERKRAEEALKRSETRFSKTFNACPEPMALVRLKDGRYVSANQACLRGLGLEAKDLLGCTPDEIDLWVHPEQRDALTETLLAMGEVRDFECDYNIKGGRIGHFLVSAEIIEIDGAPHILSVARDITERNRAEEALRASEERFSRAFNSSPQPIAITTLPEGRFIAVNHAWSKTLGFTPEETVGRDAGELNLWVDQGQRKQLFSLIEREGTARDLELMLRAKNGDLRYLTVFGEVIKLAGEAYLLLTALDVTERKLAETALRDTEQRYRLLFERNLAGVYRATLDGQYLDCNEAFAAMFGFASPAEIKAAGAWSLYTKAAAREQMIMDLRRQGSLNNYEMHLRRKDGSEIWTLANLTLLDGEGEAFPVYEGILLDITKRKQDEAKLAESREQLRALSARLSAIREEERSAIAREIHDSLGQMLTGLKLDVAWLHKRLAGSADPNKTLVQKTENMASLLDDTIQTVRDLATQLRPGVLDTLGLTAAIEWQVQDFQARTNIECEVWLCPEPKELAQEKATALFRILQEILTNIIRHAEATRVMIHLLPADGALLLSVADNGKGITTGNLKDPKSLGLLGMRERALMVGGEMKFEGAPDRGTTVTVKVPL